MIHRSTLRLMVLFGLVGIANGAYPQENRPVDASLDSQSTSPTRPRTLKDNSPTTMKRGNGWTRFTKKLCRCHE